MYLPLLASALACLQSGGQLQILHKEVGAQDDAEFGYAVARLDDVDGDGTPDYAVGARREDLPGLDRVGAVRVYSGRTHALISERFGTTHHEELGALITGIGDASGDGRGDYAVFSGGAYDVLIVSAVDNALLAVIPSPPSVSGYGSALADVGDLDGDGLHELAISNATAQTSVGFQAGEVYLHDGDGFARVATLSAPDSHYHFGRSLAAAGDVDGDLVNDFLIGAPGSGARTTGKGRVYVISGASLTPIYDIQGNDVLGHLGFAVAGGADLTGDGVPDFAASAPETSRGTPRYGFVAVFSGATGAVHRVLTADLPDTRYGQSLRFGPDMDGDGISELLLEEADYYRGSFYVEGRILVHSGWDLLPIAELVGDEFDYSEFGASFDAAGDLDGDGFGEVVVGASRENAGHVNSRGAAYVFGFRPGLVTSGRELSAAGGGAVQLRARFGPASGGHAYRILASASGVWPPAVIGGVEIPLVPDGLFNATLAGAYPNFASGTGGVLDAAGRAIATLAPGPGQLPAAWIGRTIHFAAVEGTPAGPLQSSVQQSLRIVP